MLLRRRIAALPHRAEALPIAGRYRVRAARRVAVVFGLDAFAVADDVGSAGLVALAAAAPCLRSLDIVTGRWIPGLLGPLAHGACEAGHVLVCHRPPAPPLRDAAAWREDDLLYRLLRPVARCLAELHQAGVAHGAIHPGNLFSAGPDAGVSLGCAWAAPAGSLLPPAWRPLAPRGTADDIHALGVTLLACWLGDRRCEVDAPALTARRRRIGTHAALTHGLTLPPALDRLLRRMLDDDPAARPLAACLTDPCVLLGVEPPLPVMLRGTQDAEPHRAFA